MTQTDIDWGPLQQPLHDTVPDGDGKAAWKDNAYISFWDASQDAFGTLHVSTSPNAEGRRARLSLTVDGTAVEVIEELPPASYRSESIEFDLSGRVTVDHPDLQLDADAHTPPRDRRLLAEPGHPANGRRAGPHYQVTVDLTGPCTIKGREHDLERHRDQRPDLGLPRRVGEHQGVLLVLRDLRGLVDHRDAVLRPRRPRAHRRVRILRDGDWTSVTTIGVVRDASGLCAEAIFGLDGGEEIRTALAGAPRRLLDSDELGTSRADDERLRRVRGLHVARRQRGVRRRRARKRPPAVLMTIVDTISELTPDWFAAALRSTGTIGRDVTVTGADCEPFGVGQAASVIKASLTYDAAGAGPASAVVKLPATAEASQQMAAATGMYLAEVHYYQEIAPRVQITSPEVYYSACEDGTNRFTLILEDLSGRTETGDMLLHATPKQLNLAVAELVKLQAPLWDSDELAQREWMTDSSAMRMLFGAAQAGIEPFLERFGDVLDNEQRKIVQRLAAAGPNLLEILWRPPFVVAHGDYRLDNMLFATVDDAPPICLIDWQMARSAPPGIDLAVFLATCVDINHRRANEQAILDNWVEQLHAGGVPDFPADAARERYRAGAIYPMILCVAAALTLGQTDRDDQLWRQITRGAAALAADQEIQKLLD